MASTSQSDRILYLDTPLGKDVVLIGSFSGSEGMSRLFSYRLQMASADVSIKASDLVGKSISWRIQFHDGTVRHFSGIVSRLGAGSVSRRKTRSYQVEVVPWLWLLTRTADCRIFQNKSAPEIIKAIFDELGFSDYEQQLSGSYAKREYCVQYRETAFNFVSRLMEEEGIFYFFKHDEGKHTLVLGDSSSAYLEITDPKAGDLVDSWEHQYEFRTGKWARTDYNFETPSTNLLTNTNTVIDLPDASKYEIFEYPGDYMVKGVGNTGTKVRMQEEEAQYDIAAGGSEAYGLTAGATFSLGEHAAEGEAGKYLITSIHHIATDASFEADDVRASYRNTFQCVPAATPYRPMRQTSKPFIAGVQTAVVVGPSGEEIYTDKYGRVKVQFFWDRKGKKDENSSCWIRVAEHWAGKNWGMIFNPRIGQEVVVDFLEGDPDRPLIVGRVYNKEQMPPYDLPANQTQSGIKTRSTKEGSPDNFNELRFEDKKGSEDIFFHAEKDFHREVENDDDLKVLHDQTIEIKNNRTETVKEGEEKVTIEKGNRTVTVSQGNDSHQIKMGNREVKIDMGNDTLTIKMGNQTTKLDLGASSTEAMQSIELKVGQSSIKVDQTGVTIQGMMVKLNGQIQTQIQGAMTQVQGSAMTQIQGGITMIG